jgi:hypothetical protein
LPSRSRHREHQPDCQDVSLHVLVHPGERMNGFTIRMEHLVLFTRLQISSAPAAPECASTRIGVIFTATLSMAGSAPWKSTSINQSIRSAGNIKNLT